jgi:hypothetical protein
MHPNNGVKVTATVSRIVLFGPLASQFPEKSLPLMWLCTCLSLLGATPGSTLGSPRPSFLSVTIHKSTVKVFRYTADEHGKFRQTWLRPEVKLGEKPVQPITTIVVASSSHSADYLAIGLETPSGDDTICLVDLADGKQIRLFNIGKSVPTPWFDWTSDNRLVYKSRNSMAERSNATAISFEIFNVPAAHSNAEPTLLSRNAANLPTIAPPSGPSAQDKAAAEKILDSRGFLPATEAAPGSQAAITWGPYLRQGSIAAVNPRGTMIAVFGSKPTAVLKSGDLGGTWSRDGLYLLTRKSNWEPSRLPQPRNVASIQFWRGYLVVRDDDLKKQSRPHLPATFVPTDSAIHLYRLKWQSRGSPNSPQ